MHDFSQAGWHAICTHGMMMPDLILTSLALAAVAAGAFAAGFILVAVREQARPGPKTRRRGPGA